MRTMPWRLIVFFCTFLSALLVMTLVFAMLAKWLQVQGLL